MISSFHHTSFTVSDVKRARAFFIDLLGMEEIGGGIYDHEYIRRMVGIPGAVLNISVLAFPDRGHRLELIEYAACSGPPADTATNRPGNAHLCFAVRDIHAEHARLSSRGVVFKSPPNQVVSGINKGGWAVYFTGPDGIALELIQSPGGGSPAVETVENPEKSARPPTV